MQYGRHSGKSGRFQENRRRDIMRSGKSLRPLRNRQSLGGITCRMATENRLRSAEECLVHARTCEFLAARSLSEGDTALWRTMIEVAALCNQLAKDAEPRNQRLTQPSLSLNGIRRQAGNAPAKAGTRLRDN
jgi:hypothetical protein